VRMIALAAIVTGLTLAVVGCGSSKASSTSPPSSGGQPSGGNQQAFTAFRQCLEAHGVTPPSRPPQGRQQGQRPSFDAKTQAAIQACSRYRPARPQGQGGFGG
jgi:hypothetical protein